MTPKNQDSHDSHSQKLFIHVQPQFSCLDYLSNDIYAAKFIRSVGLKTKKKLPNEYPSALKATCFFIIIIFCIVSTGTGSDTRKSDKFMTTI